MNPKIEFISYRSIDNPKASDRFKTLGEIYPIQLASKMMPDWWKELSEYDEDLTSQFNFTAKKCPGIFDFLRSGYIVPAWSELRFTYDKNRQDIQWLGASALADVGRPFVAHDDKQIKGCPVNHHGAPKILKLISPWMINVPKGYSVMFLEPTYSKNNDYTVFPGRLDADIDLIENREINIFIKLNVTDKEVIIEAGTPLIQIIPFKRENFEYDVRIPTEDDERTYKKMWWEPRTHIVKNSLDRPTKMKYNRDPENKKYRN